MGIQSLAMRRNGDDTYERGFTLVEMIMAMALGMVVLSAVIGVFQLHQHAIVVQEQTIEAIQTVRAAMDMICREARMAGYNPTGAPFHGIVYQAGVLHIFADVRGDFANDPPDGDTNDANEDIIYRYDPKKRQITRNTGGGHQPFAENIEAFSVVHLDHQGKTTQSTEHIRQIRISITARVARQGLILQAQRVFRSFRLSTLVTPPNLSIEDPAASCRESPTVRNRTKFIYAR